MNLYLFLENLLFFLVVLWVGNYMLDVAQLPRLFCWEVQENSDIEIS